VIEEYPIEQQLSGVAKPYGAVISRHDQLDVYSLAFQAAQKIFALSKGFPTEERYSLTDQIRRSSRSVCANIAEGWRKRRYRAAFQSTLNIAEAEAAETQTWLDFAEKCGYLSPEETEPLRKTYDAVIGKLVVMITNPNPWLLPLKKNK
jgi:four helix bundle protein